jgi:hypothetical protein
MTHVVFATLNKISRDRAVRVELPVSLRQGGAEFINSPSLFRLHVSASGRQRLNDGQVIGADTIHLRALLAS